MSDPKAQLAELGVLTRSFISPQQHIIHKPNRAMKGQALKIHLRLEPKWVATETGGYFDRDANKQGGLFVEIAAQLPQLDAKNNAQFAWQDPAQIVRAKLGMADILGLLAAIREYRQQNRDVPTYLRDRTNPQPNAVSFFHKTPGGGTAIISYTFDVESSVLRISKGKDQARSIAINLGEEILFEQLLRMALEAYLRVGKR